MTKSITKTAFIVPIGSHHIEAFTNFYTDIGDALDYRESTDGVPAGLDPDILQFLSDNPDAGSSELHIEALTIDGIDSLYLNDKDGCDIHVVGALMKACLDHVESDIAILLTFADITADPEDAGYSGGGMKVTRDGVQMMHASDWVADERSKLALDDTENTMSM